MQHMRAFRPNKKKPVQFEALRAMEALEALEAWPGAKNSIIAFVETIDGCLMCKTWVQFAWQQQLLPATSNNHKSQPSLGEIKGISILQPKLYAPFDVDLFKI